MTTKEEITQIVNSCNCYNRDTGEWGFDNATAIEKLSIFAVSKQRELIIAFCEWCNENNHYDFIYTKIVDDFLKSN